MKITAEALQEVILATIPKEEHDDLYTLEEMADEDRAQVEMAATLLTERFVAPLIELVIAYQHQLAICQRNSIWIVGHAEAGSWIKKNRELDEQASKLLGEEVK